MAGAGTLLAASLPETLIRADGSPTPEGPRLLCENPNIKSSSPEFREIKIERTHLLGMVVTFPDQPEGIAAVENSNFYHDGLERQLTTAQGFFSRFMKIKFTSEVQREPRFLMSKIPYREYIERRITGIPQQQVDLPQIYYDGSRYPVFVLMYMATPNPGDNLEYPGIRGSYIRFNNAVADVAGKVTITWFLAERESHKWALWHEIGHTFGMGHNPNNPKSIMALGARFTDFEDNSVVLDSFDLAGICPSYGPDYKYKVLLPINFGPPSP